MIKQPPSDIIRLKDFRPVNLISIAAIVLMVVTAIWNFHATPPKIGYAIIDIVVAFINLGVMIWSLHTQRDVRLSYERLDKLLGKESK